MLFLIDYERSSGRIVELREYTEDRKIEAEKERLNLELELKRENIEREVVLLEAANQDALRKTHRRYFENINQLTSSRAISD